MSTILTPPSAPSARPARSATLEEWLAIPEERRAELIDGRIVYQGMPGPAHGIAQAGLMEFLRGPFHRRPGDGDRPGGWWISQEVDIHIGGIGCRPDAVGWRRDKHPYIPRPDDRGLVTAVPDWICEVLSTTTAHIDMGAKRVAYHRAGVEHYWLVDTTNGTLTVLRRAEQDYVFELVAGRGETVRAVPFDAIEIDVSRLLGDDEPAEPEPAPPAPEGAHP